MNLNQFAKEYSFENQMNNSKGLDSWSNYGGENLGNLVIVPGISRNRDSEILDESNFETALALLGGESKTVEVTRFGHWGCGWFEVIGVNPKDKKSLKIARDIHEQLKEYPLLDEEDYYDREREYRDEYANDSKRELAESLSTHFDIPISKKLIEFSYCLQIFCQEYYGNDSCINVYAFREPGEYDLKQLNNVLGQFEYNLNLDGEFDDLVEYLQACISGVVED